MKTNNATKLYDTNNLSDMLDDLGMLKSEAKKLSIKIKSIETVLKSQGLDSIDSEFFHASISESERKTINWQKIARSFNPSHQIITGNTKITPVTTLRIKAH